MILINQNHLDKFKFFNGCYNYYVSNGVWLMFNRKSLEYEGCYCFFEKRYIREVNKEVDSTINRLLATDMLYVKD